MAEDHSGKREKKSKRKHRKDEDEMDVDSPVAPASAKKEKKKSKDKKRKHRTEDIIVEDVETADLDAEMEPSRLSKKHKKRKSQDEADKDKKRKSTIEPERRATRQAIVPEIKEYPFFTQTFSQRVAVWPTSFDEPLTKMGKEYLDPMLNRYSPKFKGVLLAYKNVNLSDRPARANPNNPSTDDTPVILQSVNSYAPPFAWLTADLHLFVPIRGAWMEGVINLQSEGHIGVVCFDKFNASISRRSLPRGWKWVDEPQEAATEENPFAEPQDADAEEEEEKEAAEEGAEAQPKTPVSMGYWVDENGEQVNHKISFRIKNFASGSTGDYTYLSLQGTMLDDEAEKESAAEEYALDKARRAKQNPNGLLYPTNRLPEYSITKIIEEE